MTIPHDSESVLKRPLDTSLGLSPLHDHGSWLVCEVSGPSNAMVVCEVAPKLQGPSIANFGFLFPMVRPLDDFQGPLGPLHTQRPRARDHYTSSTLIGGEGGAGPSSLHTMLEGPTEYICECKMDVKFTWTST